jgi:hypothetical protein
MPIFFSSFDCRMTNDFPFWLSYSRELYNFSHQTTVMLLVVLVFQYQVHHISNLSHQTMVMLLMVLVFQYRVHHISNLT